MQARRYPVRFVRDARIPTGRSGVTLAADLFLPRGAGPVPAVVSLLPYRKDALGGAGIWATLCGFAAQGFACVLADLRGLGSSDGRARAPFDPAEADDGVAVVEWAARQPWCGGAVGMWGFSYGALLALRTATRRPPSLRAVVSVMGMLDPERDFVHPGGVPGCLTAAGMWGLGTLANLVLPPVDFHNTAEQRRWVARLERAEPYLLDLYRHPAGDDVWRARVVDGSAITTPLLCIAGWRDMFCDGSLRAFEQARGPRKLLVGPWSHIVPQEAREHPVDVHAMALRWWRRWLTDAPDGIDAEPPVTLYAQGRSPVWLDFTSWPPACTVEARVATAKGELAAAGSPDAAAEIGITAARDPTVGTLSGTWGIPAASVERALDQHDDDLRAVALTGAPQAAPLLAVGRPVVTVSLGAPVPLDRVVVKLADVGPRGRSTLISGAVAAVRPAARRVSISVTLDPTCYQLRPGHRLRVIVADGAFPRLWPAERGGGELRVDRLELALPTLVGAGRPTSLPAPVPDLTATPWLDYRPEWNIVRHPAHARVQVEFGDRLRAVLPGNGAAVEASTRFVATVQDGGSVAARVEGTSATTVRLPTGDELASQVEIRLSPQVAHATAQVTLDGVTLVERRWRT